MKERVVATPLDERSPKGVITYFLPYCQGQDLTSTHKMGMQGAKSPAGARGALASSFFLKAGLRPVRRIMRGCQQDTETRAVARSGISGVQRGSRPFAGAWGRPPVSFSPAPAGRKETLQQPCGSLSRDSCSAGKSVIIEVDEWSGDLRSIGMAPDHPEGR